MSRAKVNSLIEAGPVRTKAIRDSAERGTVAPAPLNAHTDEKKNRDDRQTARSERRSARRRTRLSARPPSLCLCEFDALFAPAVASWVRSNRELAWLAPRTAPPLSASKVVAWGRERSNRMLLWDAAAVTPIGYSELNEMEGERDHLWVGHFLLAPHHRGCGLGVRFMHALLCRAFHDLAAREVSLVVVPENASAIHCYSANAMLSTGREFKYIKETRSRCEFVRMSITSRRFEKLTTSGEIAPRSILFIDDAALLRQGPVRLPIISG